MDRRIFLTLTVLSPMVTVNLMAISDNINKTTIKVDDIYLTPYQLRILININQRIKRLKKYVGYANFNIISFSDSLFYARNYPAIGKFPQEEISLVEELFYENPNKYGFYGDKTCFNLNNKISKKNIKKIPHSGHFLFKGKPLENYTRLKKDIGQKLILTSGIRNTIKQLSLYCNKIETLKGNISLASHSIAPPAYSYHTTSDFDVGKRGWGYQNFTKKFAMTKEFKKIRKLNYISMRYTINNKDGVRYEPWHIKVI
jgi:hypothetical protein